MEKLPFAKKSLGQHWLNDIPTLTAMADAADVQADDVVLEIGPGLGTLTAVLCQRARLVIAVEFDEALAAALPQRVTAKNLQTVRSDILRFDLTSLPANYKVVANIPYYLTSKLIRTLSESTNPPAAVALLVQKEVAESVAAAPGDMSILAVTAQYYWQVSLGVVVPPQLFTPPPKVQSQILQLQWRSQPLFDDTEPNQLFRLVKIAFANRRKTLHNSLSSGLRISKADAANLLEKAQLSPMVRPQELSLQQWHDLLKTIDISGIM